MIFPREMSAPLISLKNIGAPLVTSTGQSPAQICLPVISL